MDSKKSKAKLHQKRQLEKRRRQLEERKRGFDHFARRVTAVLDRKPEPRGGELLEDRAVFSASSRSQLSPELSQEAESVADALQHVAHGEYALATEKLAGIGRKSLFSDWRLFVRGLIAFYQEELDVARQNWQRLDRSRRPARIASVLLRVDGDQGLEGDLEPPNQAVVELAKELVHRPGLVESARKIAALTPPKKRQYFSESQAAMLLEFRDSFRRADPEFVERFSQACVRAAIANDDPDAGAQLCTRIDGPPYDPNWSLSWFTEFLKFNDLMEEVADVRETFVDDELEKIDCVSAEVKAALSSEMCVEVAEYVSRNEQKYSFFRTVSLSPFEEEMLQTAIRLYPRNRRAYDLLLDKYRVILSYDVLRTAERTKLHREQVRLQERLVKTFPDDVETSLALIDYYLGEEEFAKATALVNKLSGQRHNDPLVKALPWKLKLREAFVRSRRKSTLPAVRSSLDEAEALWPKWLDKRWLAYLRAALEMRIGNRPRFEQLIDESTTCFHLSPLAAEVMTFAALQQMNLPGPELKSFREALGGRIATSNDLTDTELCEVGAFFWDLLRTGMSHKAYRLQAGRLGKYFVQRLASHPSILQQPNVSDAILWAAEHDFFPGGARRDIPDNVVDLAKTDPRVAAAILETLMNNRIVLSPRFDAQVSNLQRAALTESDPFYRQMYLTVLKNLTQRAKTLRSL